MRSWTPKDLCGLDADTVVRELFGEDQLASPWWTLRRSEDNAFTWTDHRLGIERRMTHGALVALQEVSTSEQAERFAAQNKIALLPEGGIYFSNRSVAELFLLCEGLFPPEALTGPADLYRISAGSYLSASVGYASYLFRRLVASPAAEDHDLPDPSTLTTLVLSDVAFEDISGQAEFAVFFLRRHFPKMRFTFCPLPSLPRVARLEPIEEPTPPAHIELTTATTRYETIAFYNRAQESDPITGFLYFYRVLEACFDDVLEAAIQGWRGDGHLSAHDLLGQFRTIQNDREDKWALRRVLGELVDQTLLDQLRHRGVIQKADCDALRDTIYLRRNSIAHGRPGQHDRALVPYGFSTGAQGQRDREFYDLLSALAEKALHRWVLRSRNGGST